MDVRAQNLLKTLIEHYIADGQPVGSRTLAKQGGMALSPATIRNVMADLEEAGLIVSPHTSAGRIPTARGYRMFVDTLISVQPLPEAQIAELKDSLQPDAPQRVISQASQLLSGLTHFAGIVAAPTQSRNRLRHIEFVRLSERRILLILVSVEGEVQNRILFPSREFSEEALIEAAHYLNQNALNKDLAEVRARLRADLQQLSSDMSELMHAALQASEEAAQTHGVQTVISGERHLLDADDLASNMNRLRNLFALFEQRTALAQLLEQAHHAQGVQVFIGAESGISSLDECSVVTAPYSVNGQLLGALAVIGPTRMAYERVIPIVDITARLLSHALSAP